MPLSKARDRERKRLSRLDKRLDVMDVQPNIGNVRPLIDVVSPSVRREGYGKASSPVQPSVQPDIPLYNPMSHKIGDTVRVLKGKREVVFRVPELDADGNPIYEEG